MASQRKVKKRERQPKVPAIPAELAEKAKIDEGKGRQPIGQRLRKFSMETRLKSANGLTDKIVKMFKDYIKSVVVWGSITRGDFTGKSDVDMYVIFDDTKMPLKKFDEIRDKVDKDMYRLATETDARLHVQPVLALTEFWDGIRTCHPLFYNIVREGYALHDTGFFIPMRKLLEWGKFPATVEAAETRMEGVPKRISRVQSVKLYMIAEDLYYAITDAAQSVLMYVGVGPPAPKVLSREVRKNLVETKLLEEEWAKLIDDVMGFRKAVEHKEVREITGQELDGWIERTDRYVKRMEQLLDQLELERKMYDIKKNYEVMIKASVAALKAINRLPPQPEKLPAAFKTYLVDPGLVAPWYADVFSRVIEMRKLLEDKKVESIPDRDVYMSKEYVRRFIMDVRRVVGSKVPEQQAEIPQAQPEPADKFREAKQAMDTAREIERQGDAAAGMNLPSPEDSKVRKIADRIEKGSEAVHKRKGSR